MKEQIFGYLIGTLFFFGVLFGMYWLVKNVSYWVFYEDMVIETIREQVKPEFLKQLGEK